MPAPTIQLLLITGKHAELGDMGELSIIRSGWVLELLDEKLSRAVLRGAWGGDAPTLTRQARYYSPGIGRFLQTDPLGYAGGDMNLYGYVGNDPVNLVDPLGLICEKNKKLAQRDDKNTLKTLPLPKDLTPKSITIPLPDFNALPPLKSIPYLPVPDTDVRLQHAAELDKGIWIGGPVNPTTDALPNPRVDKGLGRFTPLPSPLTESEQRTPLIIDEGIYKPSPGEFAIPNYKKGPLKWGENPLDGYTPIYRDPNSV